jgi:hypothetical protein
MNAFTYTNTKAGELLAKELSQTKDGGRAQRTASRIIEKCFRGIKTIQAIEDEKVKSSLMQVWIDHHLQKVRENPALPDICKNLAFNVIKTKIKIKKEE